MQKPVAFPFHVPGGDLCFGGRHVQERGPAMAAERPDEAFPSLASVRWIAFSHDDLIAAGEILQQPSLEISDFFVFSPNDLIRAFVRARSVNDIGKAEVAASAIGHVVGAGMEFEIATLAVILEVRIKPMDELVQIRKNKSQ
ncbi:hypothetical protein ASF49_22515 [Methylobacterium sp. Leaf104]|nr:hypothetical protein ASF49_22515 [Methylobacterium sp. Leaf104]